MGSYLSDYAIMPGYKNHNLGQRFAPKEVHGHGVWQIQKWQQRRNLKNGGGRQVTALPIYYTNEKGDESLTSPMTR